MSLRNAAPQPRDRCRRPTYPAAWACGALLVLAACGGNVQESGEPAPQEEQGETGGSGGEPMPGPTGAGAGGSYDPGPGGTGGYGETGGYDGMPSGAGAGGSYEPNGGSGGDDYDAGPAGYMDASFEPDSGPKPDSAPEPDAEPGPMNDPCLQSCAVNHPQGWEALFDLLRPCVCEPSVCDDVCADSLCAEPEAVLTDACGNCALLEGQGACMSELSACLQDPSCEEVVSCLLACQ
ncbi:MAG: hypothetical protein ACOC1F_06260 [Myxococcota bacterium]